MLSVLCPTISSVRRPEPHGEAPLTAREYAGDEEGSRSWMEGDGRRFRGGLVHRRHFLAGVATSVLVPVRPSHAASALPPTPLPLFVGGTLDPRDLQGRVAVIRFLASW